MVLFGGIVGYSGGGNLDVVSQSTGLAAARAALCGVDRGEVASDVSDPCLVLLHFERGRFEHGERGGAEFHRLSRRASDHFIFQARDSGTLRLSF